MTRPVSCGFVLLVACVLASCAAAPSAQPAATISQATATLQEAVEETAEAEATPKPAAFPLSKPGPYYGGKRTYAFEDASRDHRTVRISVWYPALLPAGSSSHKFQAGTDRDPDRSGAPYPLILSSTKVARLLAPYLVSQGFAWVSVDGIDTYYQMNEQMIDQPLDLLFALHQVASDPPAGLEGVIDTERAGAIGYSFDGYNTLALSGARIDPEHYLAQCPNPDDTTQAILSGLSAFGCGPAGDWDAFAAHAGKAITGSEDGLWQPMTDPRIRAVMPLAGEGWWLFGARGLAAVDRPALILVATEDELYAENALIFQHMGSPDKTLISFVGPGHMMIYEAEMVARMAHFAVAFFGTQLQGREDLAWYYSEDFVAQHEDLAWGVYGGE